MLSLEQEIKTYFTEHGIRYYDHTSDYHRLDFGFGSQAQKRYFTFDVKEKRQRYNLDNWPISGISEQYLFILDDLAARKILLFAPNSGLLVRDNLHRRYHLFTVVDLYLMPKQRANRSIHRNPHSAANVLKGKWLIDLRNSHVCDTLDQVFVQMARYLDQRQQIFSKTLECYGRYVGEAIGEGGILRESVHWDIDIGETR